MKILFLLCLILIPGMDIMAQDSTQISPAEKVSQKIATKMKDTLQLTGSQYQQLFTINMQLHQQKAVVRQQHAGSSSLRDYLQQIERTRDSLYKAVLPNEKYLLYKQKKDNLVNNN